MELGKGVRSRRTSLVVDPPNGKVPFTPEGRARRDQEFAQAVGPFPSTPGKTAAERSLPDDRRAVHPQPFYLNNHQIFQTPRPRRDQERGDERDPHHSARRPPPLDDRVKLWAGSSRGRWEGDSLVVETANYNGGSVLRIDRRAAAGRALHPRRRLDHRLPGRRSPIRRRTPRPGLSPTRYARVEGPIYEYACHEGNYSLVNILAGARAQEKAREQAKQGPAVGAQNSRRPPTPRDDGRHQVSDCSVIRHVLSLTSRLGRWRRR